MSSYTVVAGDTFDTIARKQYGTEVEAWRIMSANPGTLEPLSAGTTLTVPDIPEAPQNQVGNAQAAVPDEVAILIDGTRFRFWDSVQITRQFDSMDTISFGAPFDPDAPGFKAALRPFSFKSVVVTVGGAPLFTGTMLNVDPILENGRRTVQVGAYSRPGVLNDCTAPASAFPIEFNKMDLQQIAAQLTAYFGIGTLFTDGPGAVFERVAMDPTKNVLPFLTDLAKQRNLVIGSTALGVLEFKQSPAAGTPVAILTQGSSPVLSVAPAFSPQQYYSHVTGIESVIVGTSGSQFTVKNSQLSGSVRPHTFSTDDTQGGDVKAAVDAKMGRMFGNMAQYSVVVDTWRDRFGNLWAPGATIKLEAPGAMVYSSYAFEIRAITFERDGRSETATLTLVMPGAFSGTIPSTLPWD